MSHNLRNFGVEINGQWYIEPLKTSLEKSMFRVVFDINVSPGDSLSYADIKIYNLAGARSSANITQYDIGQNNISEDYRNVKFDVKLPVVGSQIRFNAGYTTYDNEGNVLQEERDYIFSGVITNVIREREGPNNVTHLYCTSIGSAKDLPLSTSSYAPAVVLLDILKDLCSTWGKTLVCNTADFDSLILTSGYVTHNDVLKELRYLSKAYGFTLLVDRDTVTCQFDNSQRKNESDMLLSAATGLIGIPEITLFDALGCTVTVRLNAYVRPDTVFEVKSDYATINNGANLYNLNQNNTTANGIYNTRRFRHRGDSHGYTWQTEIDGVSPGTATSYSSDGKLAWGTKVDQAFRVKVKQIATNLNINPSWLMAIMYHESGLSTTAKNPYSTAVGLIQFLSSTAVSLRTTTTALARMTPVQQLDYVEKYFQQYKGRLANITDCYMAVFHSQAIGKVDSYVIASVGSAIYNANANLDTNKDGTITRLEAVAPVMRSLMSGQVNAI